MSSLFSLMSLFTEDISLRVAEDDSMPTTPSMPGRPNAGFRTARDLRAPFSKPFVAHEVVAEPGEIPGSAAHTPDGSVLPQVPHMNLDSPRPQRPQRPQIRRTTTNSVHPDIIARATVDTTIAIIPASAFRRLIRIYPKATSHIVHVILSRFQRVTLATAYNYLGLSGEVLQTEENMHKFTMCHLPNFLRGDALDRLKEKFSRERERIGEDALEKGIALHNPATGRRKRSATTLRKEAALHALALQRPASTATSINVLTQETSPIAKHNPGDLFVNAAVSNPNMTSERTGSSFASAASTGSAQFGSDLFQTDPAVSVARSPLTQRTFSPFGTQKPSRMSIDSREGINEDNVFRESVLECMFKAIGLNSTTSTPREAESIEASPRLGSQESFRHRPSMGSNAFGFMDPFATSADGDAESVTSGGATANTPPTVQALAHDMIDEVEIVFFPKGSVLVEQGERNPGLYYVIDGFLDVCMPTGQASASDILPSSSTKNDAPSSSLFPPDVDPFKPRDRKSVV